MKDTILAERIRALKFDMEWAQVRSQEWLESKLDPKPNELTKELWGAIGQTVLKDFTDNLDSLDQIRDAVEASEKLSAAEQKEALKDAWRRYAEIYKKSRTAFGEYLDFVSGLLIRYQGLDQDICRLADELIRSCSLESTGTTWQSLTVLALQESFTKTLARIIRLRFPEWSVWALPLAAHEYGHVVVDEVPGIKKFVNDEVDRLLSDDARLKEAADEQTKMINCQTKKQVDVLFADAFATYSLGPAYACAAIILRFDPSSAYTEFPGRPPDAWRAFIVLGILKMMSCEAATGDKSVPKLDDLPLSDKSKDGPYAEVINWLMERWAEMLERAGLVGTLSDSDNQRLGKQSVLIWKALKRELIAKTAQYPFTRGEEGWVEARKQSQKWNEALKAGDLRALLDDLDHSPINKLRDVLNAAWLSRIYKPERVQEIESAAQILCEYIINQQRPSGAPSGGKRRSSSPHGLRKARG
jgi:hypothetical protein